MKPPRIVTALMVVTLLAVATSAAAECAWVLWNHSKDLGWAEEGWEPGAFSSKTECRQELTKALAKTIELISHSTGSKHAVVEHIEVGDKTILTYRLGEEGGKFSTMELFCLPDTVDPRGPKGKRE